MARVATQMRFDESLYEKVKYIAKQEYRSINSQIEYFMAVGVKNFEDIYGKINPEDLVDLDEE